MAIQEATCRECGKKIFKAPAMKGSASSLSTLYVWLHGRTPLSRHKAGPIDAIMRWKRDYDEADLRAAFNEA